MGKTKKAQVMFTSTHEEKDFLSKWAARENQTVSNLVETLVVDPIATQENGTLATSRGKAESKEADKRNPTPNKTSGVG